jgi:sulfoxide reductase heme-binding subunit YedZ
MQAPWCDYSGRVSALRTIVFVLLFVPAIWVAAQYQLGNLGPRPLDEAIHDIGKWALRLLLLALTVTPAIRLTGWRKLISVRRMIGVASFVYVLLHLLLYIALQAYNLRVVATEIVLRIYLLIGFVALLGLLVLAVTSTDGMIRRLGRNWRRLHMLVYPVAILGVIHHFMQSKARVDEPMVMAGLLGFLLVYRIGARIAGSDRKLPLAVIGFLLVIAGPLTALGEAIYYNLKLGFPFERVLRANLMPLITLRPGWVVLIVAMIALGLTALAGVARMRRVQVPV